MRSASGNRTSGGTTNVPGMATQQAAMDELAEQLSTEQNQQLLRTVGAFFGAVAIFRMMTSSSMYLLIFGPIVYLYLVQTCPTEQSFDVRKELKRVMRGYHLPDDHPNKPKGFFAETAARLAATVTAEIATGMGYEVTVYNFQQAALVVWVRVPVAKMDYYWIGALSQWRFIYSAEFSDDKKTD
ncbi:hypothetical protein ACA910_017177 [Epithemia clementina (nom. ined.)]